MKKHSHLPGFSDIHGSERGHTHSEDDSVHSHDYKHVEKKRLILAIIITSIAMIIEVVGGIITHSLALLSDAGHMFTHVFALSISLGAILLASKDPCHHRTYGLYRAEILGALLNSLFLFGVTVFIFYEGILRLIHHEQEHVLGMQMFIVALIGLVVNLLSVFLLHGSAKNDINIKGAFIHVIGDTVSSVAVVIGAIVIHYTEWIIVDSLIAIGIAVLIFIWAVGLFRESVSVLLEMAPKGMNVHQIEEVFTEEFSEIKEIYDMHVWVITSNMYSFTAHIVIEEKETKKAAKIRQRMNQVLRDKFCIYHTTIEFDYE